MRRSRLLPMRELARSTPAERDRFIDALRAMSLSVVVIGHCAMALVLWRHGVPTLGNALAAHRRAQLLTWIFQVVPLFFFAGGAANALSWRRHRHEGYPAWLWSRMARLVRPVLVYLGVATLLAWLVSRVVANVVSAPLLVLSTQLLWFLGVYLIVTTLAPALLLAHERAPWSSVLALVTLCVIVDVVRFGAHVEIVAIVNFVSVWALCAQLGVWYVDHRLSPRVAAIIALSGLGLDALVVVTFHYPLSMVGMPGEPISNMAPPTVVLMIYGIVQATLAIALSGLVRRLMERLWPWRYVVAVNTSAMTLYLWHLPVLIVLYVLEHVTGLSLPVRWSDGLIVMGPHYLWLWLVHASVFVAGVGGLVSVLWVFENAPLALWDSPTRLHALNPRRATTLGVLGASASGAGLLVLAGAGLAGFPDRVVRYNGLSLSGGAGVVLVLSGALTARLALAPRRLRQG